MFVYREEQLDQNRVLGVAIFSKPSRCMQYPRHHRQRGLKCFHPVRGNPPVRAAEPVAAAAVPVPNHRAVAAVAVVQCPSLSPLFPHPHSPRPPNPRQGLVGGVPGELGITELQIPLQTRLFFPSAPHPSDIVMQPKCWTQVPALGRSL